MTKLTNETDTGSLDLWVVGQSCKAGCDTRLHILPLLVWTCLCSTVTQALINRTNAVVIESGASGIFGLGFPVNKFGFSREQLG
jgi:hypothetical protein